MHGALANCSRKGGAGLPPTPDASLDAGGRGQGLLGLPGSEARRPGHSRLGVTLDGLDTPMFNPGGTKKHLNFERLVREPWLGQQATPERERFIRRRDEIEELDHQYQTLNHEVNLLARAKSSQEDDIELARRKFDDETRRWSGELEYQAGNFRDQMNSMHDQRRELKSLRDQMVEENSNIHREMREANEKLYADKQELLRHVAELTAHQNNLLSQPPPGVMVGGNISAIPKDVHFASSPDSSGDGDLGNAPSSEQHRIMANAASTPKVGILKPRNPDYNPFVNANAGRHVGQGIYNPNITNPAVDCVGTAGPEESLEEETSPNQGQERDSKSKAGFGYVEGFYDNAGDFRVYGQTDNVWKYPNKVTRSYVKPPPVEEHPDYQSGGGDDSNIRVGGIRQDGSRMGRRSSMSAGTQYVFDRNPGISELGMDCVSMAHDGAEVVQWSLEQTKRI